MSPRQRSLYKALLANVSVADLLEKAANIGDADSARSLMNLVMQFRKVSYSFLFLKFWQEAINIWNPKVCNHPELFERADVVSPFSFCNFGRPGPIMREGDSVILPYSTRSPIEYSVPILLYQDGGIIDIPSETSSSPSHSSCLSRLFNIWTPDWIHQSLFEECKLSFSRIPCIFLTYLSRFFHLFIPTVSRLLPIRGLSNSHFSSHSPAVDHCGERSQSSGYQIFNVRIKCDPIIDCLFTK